MRKAKKLHLNKETLALLTLDSQQLGKIRGGDSAGKTCPHSDCVGSCPPGCSAGIPC
jgi:hypothetical protein